MLWRQEARGGGGDGDCEQQRAAGEQLPLRRGDLRRLGLLLLLLEEVDAARIVGALRRRGGGAAAAARWRAAMTKARRSRKSTSGASVMPRSSSNTALIGFQSPGQRSRHADVQVTAPAAPFGWSRTSVPPIRQLEPWPAVALRRLTYSASQIARQPKVPTPWTIGATIEWKILSTRPAASCVVFAGSKTITPGSGKPRSRAKRAASRRPRRHDDDAAVGGLRRCSTGW